MCNDLSDLITIVFDNFGPGRQHCSDCVGLMTIIPGVNITAMIVFNYCLSWQDFMWQPYSACPLGAIL